MGLKILQTWIKGQQPAYTPIRESESIEIDTEKASDGHRPRSTTLYPIAIVGILFLLATSLIQLYQPVGPRCQNPPTRREWRTLTTDERMEFIHAVNTLARTHSQWRENGTIYDDFAILHGAIGSWAHRSASFLPWHRYTLIIYENALRKYAGFTGHIPYWDWSLDWMDLANSSIWDSVEGFGGDGDPASPETVGEGRCITTGPFAKLRPILYNHTFSQHCLSRGFHDGKTMGRLPGGAYSPESIGRILRKATYKEFIREVEIHLHGSLHQSVNGDFKAMTAANDPLFYIHHAQLDRMWWRWQQENLHVRLSEYEGKHMFNSTGNATVNDMLMFGGFAEDIPVFKVMDTEGGFLCYKY